MMKSCRSYPSAALVIFSVVPVVFTVTSIMFITMVWNNLSFSPLFDDQDILLDSPSSILKWMCFVFVVPFLFSIICVVEYYQLCNISFIRDLRANDQRKDVLSFILFLLTFCFVYLPIAGVHIQIYHHMNRFEVPTNDLLFNLQSFDEASYADKVQVFFDCRGLHNYTDWGPNIPYSCCKDLPKLNWTANVSNIFQKGCLTGLNNFVNVQVRGQTFTAQAYCLAVGVILLLIGVISLHFARKVYYRNFKC